MEVKFGVKKIYVVRDIKKRKKVKLHLFTRKSVGAWEGGLRKSFIAMFKGKGFTMTFKVKLLNNAILC